MADSYAAKEASILGYLAKGEHLHIPERSRHGLDCLATRNSYLPPNTTCLPTLVERRLGLHHNHSAVLGSNRKTTVSFQFKVVLGWSQRYPAHVTLLRDRERPSSF